MRLTKKLGLIGGVWMALATWPGVVPPAAAETASEKAAALLDGLIRTNDAGLAVLVAQDGKILLEKGSGMADRENHAPVIPQTTFRIGPLTMQFTASAILKLQEEGKLNVDDKLSKYFPDFPRGAEVTLRQLLTHTTGLHDYADDKDFVGDARSPVTPEALIEQAKKFQFNFDPGMKWRYSNSGYVLLGGIVEKVSGQSYGDFLRANFFQPLGMTNTGVQRAGLPLPHEAQGYGWDTNGFTRGPDLDLSWLASAGALYSTAQDLYRWSEGVFNGRVLDTASLKAAFTPVATPENQGAHRDTGFGFGWVAGRHRGLRELFGSSAMTGFRGCLLRLPEEKFTVVVLANAQPGKPEADPLLVAHQLADIYLADKLEPLPVVNPNVSPQAYNALVGCYDVNPGQVAGPADGEFVTISRRGSRLFSQIDDQPENEIFPRSDTEFFAKEWDGQTTFVKDGSGRAVKLVLRNYGLDLAGLRLEDAAVPWTNASPAGAGFAACALPRLKVSENKHFLVGESGQPFFWLGDTGWELFDRLNREEAGRYLANRAAKGFTVIQAVIFPSTEWLPETNAFGEPPFQNDDPTKPNERYFQHVDWIVNRANSLGLYMGMLPTWGTRWYNNFGEGPDVVFTPENAAVYGEWLGRRYRDCALVWILGGDRPIVTRRQRAIIDALAAGLRRGDGGAHLITFHPCGYSGSSAWLQNDPRFDFNLRQNGHNTEYTDDYGNTRVDYDRQPAKPVIDAEPLYEDIGIAFDGLKHGSSVAADVRRPLYWDLFGGACGHTYGNHAVWQFWAPPRPNPWSAVEPWDMAIDAPGAFQMQHAKRLLLSRPFLTRVPDDSILVPDATRTRVPGGGLYRFVATRDSEGRYAMVYVPVGITFSVRTDCIQGSAINAWWFNPRNGKASLIGKFSKTPEHEFTPPEGGEVLDWVLVLDDAAMEFPPPGSVIPVH